MRIYRTADYAALSRKAAHIIDAQITTKPDCVLGLATGSTPVGMYRQLVEWYDEGDLDFGRVRTVNLDEYLGLPPSHSQSYRRFMDSNLFDRVNIDKTRTNVPDGLAPDVQAECARYDRLIEDMGGVDIQVLGMGHNGHIGFNEPADHFELGTHVVELAPSTIEANSRFFTSLDDVPRRAITMGMRNIMSARCILMVVSGGDKADIVARAFTGYVTPRVPASLLQLHPNAVLVGDEAALSRLPG